MRKCPKCGAKYEDADFRTLCSMCMVDLVVDTAPPAGELFDDGPIAMGPVSIGGPVSSPVAIITPVEMAIPEIAPPPIPEVPQIPAPPPSPEQQPGPMPSPLTPQPDPGQPQPQIIPEPQPAPVPAPMPAPQPTPTPQPLPPDPTQPAGNTQIVPLRPEELATSKVRSFFFGVLAAVCGIITLSALRSINGEEFGILQLLVLGGLVALTIYLVRQAIFYGAIHRVNLISLKDPRLGAVLPVQVIIATVRDLPVDGMTLTLTAEERAVSGTGKSQVVQRNILYTHETRVPVPNHWPGAHEVVVNAEVPVPADALPSFTGRTHTITWTLTLHVEIPAWYPNIRKTFPVSVPATKVSSIAPQTGPVWLNLPQLGTLHAHLVLDCEMNAAQQPVLPAGQAVPFTLALQPVQGAGREQLTIQLVYAIQGGGEAEYGAPCRVRCFKQGWLPDKPQEESGVLQIPAIVPITCQSKLMQVSWQLAIRRESPGQPELRQDFVVEVVPKTTVPSGLHFDQRQGRFPSQVGGWQGGAIVAAREQRRS